MATFVFYQDYTITLNKRDYYTIEAKTLAQARKLARESDGDLENCPQATYLASTTDDCDGYYDKMGNCTIYDDTGEEIE